MKKINYKLIVSDCDGTLLTSGQVIPEEVKAAINEYVSSGGIFAVCTGRMLKSILPRVKELGLKGLVVAYQGTVIADIESGKIIKKGHINYSDVAEICAAIESRGQNMNVYSDEVFYTDLPKDNEGLRRYEEITGVQGESICGAMSQFVLNNKLDCQKVTSLVLPKDRDGLYTFLLDRFKNKFDVTCSAKELVEVSPLSDNKGAALKYIADYFNIPLSSTVAIGDNLNDLPMIKEAAVGVAVGNAVEGLKEAADVVTVTNNEGAVAKIIEKYGFI